MGIEIVFFLLAGELLHFTYTELKSQNIKINQFDRKILLPPIPCQLFYLTEIVYPKIVQFFLVLATLVFGQQHRSQNVCRLPVFRMKLKTEVPLSGVVVMDSVL